MVRLRRLSAENSHRCVDPWLSAPPEAERPIILEALPALADPLKQSAMDVRPTAGINGMAACSPIPI